MADAAAKKILWVEDDAFLNDLVASKLSRLNYKLFLVSSGDQAFAQLERELPDVVVLDLVLPGMSGFEILEKLKGDDRYKQIPVIVLSNLGQESDVEHAKKLGAAQYLIKSNFNLDDIVGEVNKLFAHA